MVSSEQLFRLIKSLSKTEKGYFKKFSSLHIMGEKNNYVKLFDAIDQMREYDEEKVKEKLSGERFIKRLSSEKVYLNNLILKSMTAFHSSRSMDAQLHDRIRQIGFLFSKGLHEHGNKLLTKTILLAKKYDKPLVLLELATKQIDYMRSGNGVELFEANKKIRGQQAQILDNYKELIQYNFIASELFIHTEKVGLNARDKNDLEIFIKKFNSLLKNNKLHSESFHTMRLSLFCKFILYALQDNETDAYNSIKELVRHIESHTHLIDEDPRIYSTALNNLAICESALKKYKQADITLHKMHFFASQYSPLKNQVLSSAYNIELSMCLEARLYERGYKLMNRMQSELVKHNFFPPNKHLELNMYFFFASLNIVYGKYKAAAHFLNIVIGGENENLRSDIQSSARILRLIVYFELRDELYLEYLLRATYKYLLKKGSLYEFEKEILEFIKRRGKQNALPLEKEFKLLRNKLLIILKDPHERKAMIYFNFPLWLESKIKGTTILDLVKNKK